MFYLFLFLLLVMALVVGNLSGRLTKAEGQLDANADLMREVPRNDTIEFIQSRIDSRMREILALEYRVNTLENRFDASEESCINVGSHLHLISESFAEVSADLFDVSNRMRMVGNVYQGKPVDSIPDPIDDNDDDEKDEIEGWIRALNVESLFDDDQADD